MRKIRNITVTDDRVRNAVSKAMHHSLVQNTGVFSETLKTMSGNCELLEATVRKWFVGLDKVCISVNGEEVEAFLNYPFMNSDFIISVVPEGQLITDDPDGAYIKPTTSTIANVLKHNEEYCVLGFKRGDSTKSSDIGEILLQAGNNQIIIGKEYISINTNALYINGVKKDVEP